MPIVTLLLKLPDTPGSGRIYNMRQSTFLRLPDVPETHDEICDEFEAAWAEGLCPDVAVHVRRVPEAAQCLLAIELIKIDLERRWVSRTEPLTIPQYLEHLASISFADEQISKLVEKEFVVRLSHGEALRIEALHEYAEIISTLPLIVKAARSQIDWPSVSLVVEGRTRVQVELDRPIVLGRQAAGESPAESVITSDHERRLVVVGSHDASVSRQQLRLEILAPKQVRVTNVSANRAIGVAGRGTLESGEHMRCVLPVSIPLTDRTMLLIMESEGARISQGTWA